MKVLRDSVWRFAYVVVLLSAILFFLTLTTGCGWTRSEATTTEGVIKTTEVVTRPAIDPASGLPHATLTGEPVMLVEKTEVFTETISQAQVEIETKIQAPEFAAMKSLVSVAAKATGFGWVEGALGVVTAITGAAAGKKALDASKAQKAVRLVAGLADKFAAAETDEEVETIKKQAAEEQERAGVRTVVDRARGRI